MKPRRKSLNLKLLFAKTVLSNEYDEYVIEKQRCGQRTTDKNNNWKHLDNDKENLSVEGQIISYLIL